MLDVMNIAGPSGTNKQLPKPPPRPLLSSMNLQREKTSLKYFCALFLPLGLRLESGLRSCDMFDFKFPTVWVFVVCLSGCLYVVITIRRRVCFDFPLT